jgi:anaerobic ribonucleoside-triphosphate reductase activating protein
MLNIHHIETANFVNGDGLRYVLWLQGCNLACDGCWNREMWSFKDKILKNVDEVFQEIVSTPNLDGVTFTGGEPFLQAEELSKLAEKVKLETDLTIQVFTGFEIEELTSTHQKRVLEFTDVLVSGRFDSTKENNNQKVKHLNSDVDIWNFNNSDIQIDIDHNGNLQITGYPIDSFIENVSVVVKN